MSIRLRITKHDDEHIRLEAIQGINHFGFGTFLLNLQPEEIESDNFSKNALLEAHEQSGLNGLEIWEDNRLAWGDASESIIMPTKEISKQKGADNWISNIIVE